jgi:hypothetical protein
MIVNLSLVISAKKTQSRVFSFILQRTEGKTKTFIEAEKGICFGCGREQFVLTRIFNTKLCYIDIGSTC